MKASCSMFSQILKLISRTDFERAVKETGAEYRSKGLSRGSQFVGMLFCQLGRAHSLREIEGGLKSCEGIVVDDRGYNDYRLFAQGTDTGVHFVARMKDNALFEVVEEHAVPQNRNILQDQTIRLAGTGAQEKCPHLLRRVEAVREDTGGILVFITHHHALGASTIAAIYKDRWQIELFFKALKQNLNTHRD